MTPDAIREALSDEDPEARHRAVIALEASAPDEATELVLKALGDTEWRVRKEAVRVAAKLAQGHPMVADLTAAVSQGENVGLRSAAMEVLGRIGPSAGPHLVRALETVPETGRKFLVAALGEVGGAEVLPALTEVARSDDVNLVAAAIDALARVGGPVAIDVLKEQLSAGDSFIRLSALDGIDRLGGSLGYDELEPLLTDRLLRRVALKLLGRVESPQAVGALCYALEDASPTVVGHATASLYQLCAKTPAAFTALAGGAGHLTDAARERVGRLVREGDLVTRWGASLVALLARDEATLPAVVAMATQEEVPPVVARAFREWGPTAVSPLLEVHEGAVGAAKALSLELATELGAPVLGSDAHLAASVRSALRRGLRHPELAVRVAAARGLGAFAEAEDTGRLVASAMDGPAVLSRATANALRALHERAPHEVEVALGKVELDGPGGAALTSLVGDVCGESALTHLSAALSADDAPTRKAAIAALAALPGAGAAQHIVLGLADEDIDVQVEAARALGALDDAEGREAGVEQLLLALSSNEPAVQAEAAASLAALGEGRAIEPLRDLLREGSPGVAVAAMAALRALSDPTLRDLLVEALGHEDGEVVKQVLSAIAETGGPRSRARLAVALSHGAWDVRRHAAELLGRMGGGDALSALTARAAEEQDELVSEALSAAISIISAGEETGR